MIYYCDGKCKPAKGQRHHLDGTPQKAKTFRNVDAAKLDEIENKPIPHWVPPHRMMNVAGDEAPWGDKWRAGTSSFRTVQELYTRKNLWALACILDAIKGGNYRTKDGLLFAFTSILLKCSRMMAHNNDGIGRIQKGTYYVPQVIHDVNVGAFFEEAVADMAAGYREIGAIRAECAISTADSRRLDIDSDSVDYVFTDPPYAGNVQYGELNFVWEAWLNFDTEWHADEIVVNEVRKRTEGDWRKMMKDAFAECFRALKPGRWLSLCYHDTSEGTWEAMQDLMTEVGFVPENIEAALYIGTKAKTTNQYFADKVTKRDLVFNFRKPRPGDWKIARVVNGDTFRDAGTAVIRDYLTEHPGSTKDRIYDELVSRLVRTQQMEAHDFEALLRTVAEEVKEPIKKNLFENKDADLFGGHVTSRWYLKETADQIDPSEQNKEDAAADKLETFMTSYLKKHPVEDGVHYSDLFEQYLPVGDKPRRLLADWLPEYFFKTPSGTWRPPADKKEQEQKAALREAGTLRRMKRFANALIDGVPVREQDRPANDRTLAEWIRQCRRAGLYEQGRALYEKGGLNTAGLSEDEQVAVEDDYRLCVKRFTQGEEKPKAKAGKGRKKSDDE